MPSSPPLPQEHQYDAFISHASEDKDALVRPLAGRLRSYGARIWYDEFELKPGASIVAALDRGLTSSNYGILILSPAFLGKHWPEYERQGLTARDVAGGGSVLVPVWHGVGPQEVAAFSPTLAQRMAVIAGNTPVDDVALRLLEVIRPDLAEAPLRRALFHEMTKASGPPELVDIRELRRPEKAVHATLPGPLLRRIRLAQEALFHVLPMSYEEWVENAKRDLHPEDEIEKWESIAGMYLAVARSLSMPSDAHDARRDLLSLILAGHSGLDVTAHDTPHLDPRAAEQIRALFARTSADAD